MTIMRSQLATSSKGMAIFLALTEAVAAAATLLVLSAPASAQFPWWGDRPRVQERAPRSQQNRRPEPPREQGLFPFFRPFGGQWREPWAAEPAPPSREPREPREPREARQAPVDYSKAPPPRKAEGTPAATAMVFGDSMADWLGYGLEEALSERPEIGVVRKIRANSGLIRGESRNDSYDWVQTAREAIGNDNPLYVVMMIGLGDRQPIRAPRAQPQPGAQPQQTGQPQQIGPQATQEAPVAAPEPPQSTAPHEFRSEKWGELYAKRIDEMIAALKSKGAAVFWVGLPPVRGARSTADTVYLNQLFRGRAEKAGAVYVDIWDGFVDEGGAYTSQGPDFEGQTRRLRTGDGVHFTKAGARKLAHYVDREIQRVIQSRTTPVALPEGEAPQEGAGVRPGGPAPRPVAGPVMPLTAPPRAGDGLLGSGIVATPSHRAIADQVLVKGEPIAAPEGRADNFAWPRQAESETIDILPPVALPPAPTGTAPLATGQAGAPAATPPRTAASPQGR